MLSLLVTSTTRRKLLTRFFTHPGERFYQSQLIRELGLSSSLVQKELARLTTAGVLTSEREGNTRFFSVNRSYPLFSELKSIIYKTEGLGDALREHLAGVPGLRVALVYGSVARDLEDAVSDVDLLVIGDIDSAAMDLAVSAAETALGREVNTTVLTQGEWRARIDRGQAFAVDIARESKIFIIGGDNDLR